MFKFGPTMDMFRSEEMQLMQVCSKTVATELIVVLMCFAFCQQVLIACLPAADDAR